MSADGSSPRSSPGPAPPPDGSWHFSPPPPAPDEYTPPPPESIALPGWSRATATTCPQPQVEGGRCGWLGLAAWLVVALRRRRAAARGGNRAVAATTAGASGGSSHSQPPKKTNVIHDPKSPPPPAPDEYTPPPPESIALPGWSRATATTCPQPQVEGGRCGWLGLAAWLVVALRRKRAAARGGDRALETAVAATPAGGSGGSSHSQPPKKTNVIYDPKSPPPGGPPAPQDYHHSVELTPPATTTAAASSSGYLSSGGSSNSKSHHDDWPRGQQPVSLPAGEVLFRGAFGYGELAAATNGFSDSNLLGRGGFGDVYVGTVDGADVAVKRLRAGSQQGDPEFQAELRIISRVHHRNLVSLVGYCVADAGQRLLVYEFVPNSTLHHHLHARGGVEAVLDWPIRWTIAFGAAKGLAYLHEDCHPRIIHRDIKAANILLDHDFNPKVSDFGMAKFIPGENTHIATRIVGTIGYLAPEYASSGKLTEKSDVFSFGVVLLELITGMNASMPSDPDMEDTLVGWARPLLARALELGDYDDLVDPLLLGYDTDQMGRLVRCAAAAVSRPARRRPRMSQIVRHLAGDASAEEIDACGVRSSLGDTGSVDGADTSLQFRPMRYNEIRTSRRQARADRLHQSAC
ncbi:hypothetical protein BS78_02G157400 [Paspalum vaginatum]|nr:hypothetical protein BS78_02G157400 [Paspalum vaginatum]